MFKEIITNTGLTDDSAGEFFSRKITAYSYGDDVTFSATLNALAYPRMGEENTLAFEYSTSHYKKDFLERHSSPINRVLNSLYDHDELMVHNICSDNNEDNTAWYKYICENFIAEFGTNWKRVDSITALFRKSFDVACFINETNRITIVVVPELNIRKYHYLQCGIIGMLPWFFPKDKGLTELETQLIYSLREKTPDKYLEIIEKIASQYNFEEDRIRNLLDGYEKKFEEIEIRKTESAISSMRAQLERYEECIQECIRNMRDANTKLSGLRYGMQDIGSSEIMDFFLSNHNVRVMSVYDTRMTFIATGYCTYYDTDLVKAALKERSYIYGISGLSKEDTKLLLEKIFIDEVLKLKFCAAFTLDIGTRLIKEQHYTFGERYAEYMPNTHINQYGCMGGYSATIEEMLNINDNIGVIEQCIASCKSLNFNDTTVMSAFIPELTGRRNGRRCIELPNGNMVSAQDAVKWLREHNTNE